MRAPETLTEHQSGPMGSTLGYGIQGSKTVAWLSVVGLLIAMLAAALVAPPADASMLDTKRVDLVVREVDSTTDEAELLVDSLGGAVTAQLGIIGGFSATVPADVVDLLRTHPSVQSVSLDVPAEPRRCEAGCWASTGEGAALREVARTIGANDFWRSGYRGRGVDIALLDTGVSPVDGLHQRNKIVNGPDLSFESQNSDFRYLDTNGHGTHLAGIIAGFDRGTDTTLKGIAFRSRIVNVKVGSHDGSVDVSQVIAGIDWVVQHRNDNGMNIRVLNLSYGTDSLQDPLIDPLSFAVEQAWKAGIVVVVAAGNDGPGVSLTNPASNPYVIAVGASDIGGNARLRNDRVAGFSSCGVGRTVDLVAPGKSIESLRVENSLSDVTYPEARISHSIGADTFDLFRGTGSSQAAAVVAGAAALIVDQRPTATPDEVKQLLIESARPLPGASIECQGAGQIDLGNIKWKDTPKVKQDHPHATGTGSLDAARGSHRVGMDGEDLVGEQDIHGREWSGPEWATASAAGRSWSGGDWNGTSWSGLSWSGLSWSGLSWSGLSWTGSSWSGTSWSNQQWTGSSWSGSSWSGDTWTSASWSGSSWSSISSPATSGPRWD